MQMHIGLLASLALLVQAGKHTMGQTDRQMDNALTLILDATIVQTA